MDKGLQDFTLPDHGKLGRKGEKGEEKEGGGERKEKKREREILTEFYSIFLSILLQEIS